MKILSIMNYSKTLKNLNLITGYKIKVNEFFFFGISIKRTL